MAPHAVTILLALLPLALAAPVEWLPDGKLHNNVPFNLPSGIIDNSHPAPDPPVFPKQYEVKYQFSMPYTLAFQAEALSYDVHLWHDAEKGHFKIETLGGLDTTVVLDKYVFKAVPRLNETFCYYVKKRDDDSKGMTGGDKGIPVDMGNWTYSGRTTYEGRDADIWVESVKKFSRVEYYYFYVSLDGRPLFLSVMGQNWFSGSHFDQYLAKFDYDSWKPGALTDDDFDLPKACYDDETKTLVENTLSSGMGMMTLVPTLFRGDPEYDLHAAQHGRFHEHAGEYHSRLELFKANKAMIEAHNARNDVSYTLGLNRFADMTEDEFRSTSLGRRLKSTGDDDNDQDEGSLEEVAAAPSSGDDDKGPDEGGDEEDDETPSHKGAAMHKISGKKLPESLDWEGTLTDGIVKDQANCGSCWAFGAVATMESAWYIATGQHASFAEQQIVDCAWDFDMWGCDGGWSENAINYVAQSGGIMTENEYKYIGQDDWCRFNTTEEKDQATGFFKGYAFVPPNDTTAIKDALYTKGVLSVSLDASFQDFRFYIGGVYDNVNCSDTTSDHVVAMVGYGEENGKPYYKIRNSWSKYWGQEGYAKMAIEHSCGLDMDAVYAIVDEDKAKQARMRRNAQNN